MTRPIRAFALLAGAVAIAAVAASAGRLSADDDYSTGYVSGLQDGAAQGQAEGRALQETLAVPGGDATRQAFVDGYAAGADDVFAGYDGGWNLSQPYVVTLERAESPLTYRIASRTLMDPGVTYYRCGARACEGQPR